MDRGVIAIDGTPRDVFSRLEAMRSLGLQLPQVTLLLHRLQESGCALNTNILTIEDACTELLSRMNSLKGEPDVS
jgi:hypothetical protein